ncbi:hypothetical protein [Desulfoluna sp.]|uniref:hypothetical protein n=1 Tax=Desulfoluna sp. TaxID=2045199 RepID=UPI00260C470A|nr:hypothetical protein [Desulfoluna sp.]
MADQKNTQDDPHKKISDAKAIDELVQAAQDQAIKMSHAKQAHGESPERARLTVWILVITLLVLIASFILHYDQMFHPFHRPEARQIEHAARLEIITAADLLDQFRSEQGELPINLPEALNARDFIDYGRVGDNYTLTMKLNGKVLQFQEGDDKIAFLKDALTD